MGPHVSPSTYAVVLTPVIAMHFACVYHARKHISLITQSIARFTKRVTSFGPLLFSVIPIFELFNASKNTRNDDSGDE